MFSYTQMNGYYQKKKKKGRKKRKDLESFLNNTHGFKQHNQRTCWEHLCAMASAGHARERKHGASELDKCLPPVQAQHCSHKLRCAEKNNGLVVRKSEFKKPNTITYSPRVSESHCPMCGAKINCMRILWETKGGKHSQGPTTHSTPSITATFIIFSSNSTTLREQVSLPTKFKVWQDKGKTGDISQRAQSFM